MSREFLISPQDPIIARDGRPFGVGQGLRMKALQWPYPSTLAGAIRTMLGKREGAGFPPETVRALKTVAISGPLPSAHGSLYFPAPRDAVRKGSVMFAARPEALGEGEGMAGELMPVCLPAGQEDFKPDALPAFWPQAVLVEWLLAERGENIAPPVEPATHDDPTPQVEYRTQTSLDEETGSAKKSMLFQTAGLRFPSNIQISARVNAEGFDKYLTGSDTTLHPLGGERRLARWAVTDQNLWTCPARIAGKLAASRRIRMVLATPAIFEGGWMPAWLEAGYLPAIPAGTGKKIPVALRGAIVDRWKPISGWSLENGRTGAKPVRRLVPAGSVYFLEITDDTPFAAADYWLRSVCDAEQDQLDGFGAAVWGTWEEHQ